MAAFSFLTEADYGTIEPDASAPTTEASARVSKSAALNGSPAAPSTKAPLATPSRSEAPATRKDLETLSLYVEYLERRFEMLEQQRQSAARQSNSGGGGIGVSWTLVVMLGIALILLWSKRPVPMYLAPSTAAIAAANAGPAFLAANNAAAPAYYSMPTPGGPPPVSFLPR